MSRTCESCGRSWRGSATFCGACGDLLPDAMAATVVRDDPASRRGPRRPVLAVVLGVAVLAGAAAVPSLTVERTPPVTGEIGVPETDDLQAAPAGTRPRREVAAPEVTCSRQGEVVDCVAWSRDLAGAPGPQGQQTWPLASGDHLLLVGPEGVEGVDALTGTRRWRMEAEDQAFPRDMGPTAAVLEGPQGELQVIDLATGDVRWRTSDTRGTVQGQVLHDDLVLTSSSPEDSPGVVARQVDDGTRRWEWTSPWSWVQTIDLGGGRLLVSPASDQDGLAILDARTGAELARSDVRTSWWMQGVVDETIVLVEPLEAEGTSSGDGLAGDDGAILRGVSLDDGTARWERPLPAHQVQFGLADGVVLAPSTGTVQVIEVATGEVAWEAELDPLHDLAHHGPGGFGPTTDWTRVPPVVVTMDHGANVVQARDPATGELRWEHPVGVELHMAGVTADVVWVQHEDGFLVLDATTGREDLRIHASAQGVHPVSLDPLLLFHHESGTVVRIDADADRAAEGR